MSGDLPEIAERCDWAALEQLARAPFGVWDGDLISKVARGRLVKAGYATRGDGMNYCTENGHALLFARRRSPP